MNIIHSRALRGATILAATGLAVIGATAATASATISAPAGSTVNTGFAGSGNVVDSSGFGPGALEFMGTSTAVTFDFSGDSFTSDAPTLNYTPTAFEGALQPSAITIGDGDFTGMDTLTVDANDALNVNLAGTFTGPGGTIGGVGGELYTFTGTATETGGSGVFTNADSTLPFAFTILQTGPTLEPAGVLAPHAPNATYTAIYGPAAVTVPESGSLSLLALGILPLGFLAKKRLSRGA